MVIPKCQILYSVLSVMGLKVDRGIETHNLAANQVGFLDNNCAIGIALTECGISVSVKRKKKPGSRTPGSVLIDGRPAPLQFLPSNVKYHLLFFWICTRNIF